MTIVGHGERGSRLDELAERWELERALRELTVDPSARATDEPHRVDYEDQPRPAWRRLPEDDDESSAAAARPELSGAERLAAFGRLSESEQERFWSAVARLAELRERAARAEVVS